MRGPVGQRRVERLRAHAHEVLAGNWREGTLVDGTPYAFTCPSPPRYRHQWYWDSCFHANWDLAGRDHVPLRVSTWSSLAPLALPSLPEDIARRLIEEHLLHPLRYGARYGIPSVSMEEPSFRAGWHLFRCWRGPAWINTVWLLVPAMRRLGYGPDADRIVASCVELVERHGFREYYNPINGEGLAARRFGFSTLLVDLLPAAEGRRRESSDTFVGSIPNELWSMGTEVAAETRRRLSGRASVVRPWWRR